MGKSKDYLGSDQRRVNEEVKDEKEIQALDAGDIAVLKTYVRVPVLPYSGVFHLLDTLNPFWVLTGDPGVSWVCQDSLLIIHLVRDKARTPRPSRVSRKILTSISRK